MNFPLTTQLLVARERHRSGIIAKPATLPHGPAALVIELFCKVQISQCLNILKTFLLLIFAFFLSACGSEDKNTLKARTIAGP